MLPLFAIRCGELVEVSISHMSMSRSSARGASYKNIHSLSVIYVTLQKMTARTFPKNVRMGGAIPIYSPPTDPLLLLWEDVIVIVTRDSFNHALTVLTHVRFGQLPLRTRILILVAHGFT